MCQFLWRRPCAHLDDDFHRSLAHDESLVAGGPIVGFRTLRLIHPNGEVGIIMKRL